MNEKIKLFAKQAEQYADDIFNSDPAKYDTPEQEKVWCEMMQEKFAELIVKDCAEQALKKGMASPDTDFRTGSFLISEYLLGRYGVEE